MNNKANLPDEIVRLQEQLRRLYKRDKRVSEAMLEVSFGLDRLINRYLEVVTKKSSPSGFRITGCPKDAPGKHP